MHLRKIFSQQDLDKHAAFVLQKAVALLTSIGKAKAARSSAIGVPGSSDFMAAAALLVRISERGDEVINEISDNIKKLSG